MLLEQSRLGAYPAVIFLDIVMKTISFLDNSYEKDTSPLPWESMPTNVSSWMQRCQLNTMTETH